MAQRFNLREKQLFKQKTLNLFPKELTLFTTDYGEVQFSGVPSKIMAPVLKAIRRKLVGSLEI